MGPLDLFFKMGEKATKGDPQRQADFIYYMVWILFIAFATMFLSNAYRLFVYEDINYAVWTLVGFAVSGIQYFSLKGMYDMRKMTKKPIIKDEALESVDAMMEEFSETKSKKEVKKCSENKKTKKK